MKIGILNSDTVQIDGAAEFGQYPEMFSKVFWAVEPKIPVSYTHLTLPTIYSV